MKGTGAVAGPTTSAGFGAKSASFGGRPSAGKISASLPGAEGRPAFATAFTSRALAAHKSSPINREAISKVNTRPSMFNINRPTRPSFVENHAPKVSKFSTPKSEFGVRVNSKNGTEAHPKTARVRGLESQRPMFNRERKAIPEFGKRLQLGKVENVIKAQRPIERNIVTPRKVDAVRLTPREVHKTVARRTQEVGLNPKVRSERVKSVSPFENTVILWQRKDVSPRVKLEAAARLVGKPEEQQNKTQRIVKTLEKARQDRKEHTKKVKRVKSEAPKRVRVGNRIKALPEVSQDVKNVVNADIKEAQKKAIYNIIAVRGVNYEKALEEVVEQLAKKHEGKVKVMPAVKPQIEAQTQVQTQTEVQALTQTQPKIEAEVKTQVAGQQETKTKKILKKIFRKKPTTEEYKLHFKKDEETNKKRLERVKKTFEKLHKWNKREITGFDIAYEMGPQKEEEVSELTRIQNVDYRLGNFMKAIKYMGEIKDIKTFFTAIRKYSEYYSAVRLAKEGEEENAVGQDAIEVYGKPLYNVNAYVADEGSEGKLRARAETIKVTVVKNGKEVVYYAPEEKELPQAA